MTKYAPLEAHLRAFAPPIRMTFEEVAALVGGLPPSAYRHQAWWANSSSHVEALAWLDADLRVAEVDLAQELVPFGR